MSDAGNLGQRLSHEVAQSRRTFLRSDDEQHRDQVFDLTHARWIREGAEQRLRAFESTKPRPGELHARPHRMGRGDAW